MAEVGLRRVASGLMPMRYDSLGFFFIVCWAILPVVWHHLMKAIGLSFLRPTLPNYIILCMYVFQYIGLPILYFGWDAYRFEAGVVDQSRIMQVWIFTSLSITSLIIGFAAARLRLGPLSQFSQSRFSLPTLRHKQYLATVFFGLGAVAVLLMYLDRIGLSNVALFSVIDGNEGANLTLSRSKMGNDFGGGYHWYAVFMRDAFQFVWLVLLVDCLFKATRWKIFYLVLFGMPLAFSLLMATEKAPIAVFLLGVMLSVAWAKLGGRLSLRILLTFGMAVTLALAMSYIFFMGDADFFAAIWSIISRGLAGSIHPAYFYLELFPNHLDWLQGQSFPNPGGILPFVPYELTVEVMNWMNPEDAVKGIVGSAPTVYWGEIYANFGPFAVPLAGILLGYWLYALNFLVFRYFTGPVGIALLAWLMIHYQTLAVTSFSVFVFDIALIVVVSLALLIKWFRSAASGRSAESSSSAFNRRTLSSVD